ncbi:MAG: FAD/NAD(P)-binding protein [Rhodopirellula sp. JB044]|uniref:FAD/NAD(P)-binding protein n=1 Tax=Rhodopirellula sp. JB044 TaxID=3342844 RepID=UPI00370B5F0A
MKSQTIAAPTDVPASSPPIPTDASNAAPTVAESHSDAREPEESILIGREYRIGVVGCGPRGLYCLQSLADELAQMQPPPKIAIFIFEPADFPGAGNVYDPRQPRYLRMNFAAKNIDAWPPRNQPDDQRFNLVEWLRREAGEETHPNSFVSRASVGQYLHRCYHQVKEQLESGATVTVIQERVSSIARLTDAWQIRTDRMLSSVDELLITTGHGPWDNPPDSSDPVESTWIPTFPVGDNLSADAVPPQSTVAIRGFGLTCIDATLAMTEGRGGEFERSGQDWRYQPTGQEPKCLYPFSRSGRPMLAKPDETLFQQPDELCELWSAGRNSISNISQPITSQVLSHTLWPLITDTAAKALQTCQRVPTNNTNDIRTWFDLWCEEKMNGDVALQTMRESFRVATGQSGPDIAWALGITWRNLYPALVNCISYGRLTAEAWPKFRRIAVEMERIAFGPPAENVGKLLALIDAFVVDLRFVCGRTEKSVEDESRLSLRDCSRSNARSHSLTVDRCVNAVLKSPRQCLAAAPFDSLEEQAIIERLQGPSTLRVDEAGKPVRHNRDSPDRLSILGRSTEGCVLGNDTLIRTLHDHPQRWATSVAANLRKVNLLT